MLPSDGKDGIGEAREGCLGVAKRKEVGSLEDVLERWRARIPAAKVLAISALEGINTDEVSTVLGASERRLERLVQRSERIRRASRRSLGRLRRSPRRYDAHRVARFCPPTSTSIGILRTFSWSELMNPA